MAEVIAAAGSKTILAAEVVPDVITQYEPPSCSLASVSSLGGGLDRRARTSSEESSAGLEERVEEASSSTALAVVLAFERA